MLPSGIASLASSGFTHDDFITDFLLPQLNTLRGKLKENYPYIFIIMGNDDGRYEEAALIKAGAEGYWNYVHGKKAGFYGYDIYGYSYVPPTPFLLKDWEKYDVSRYVDPGCISPEDGKHSIPIGHNNRKYETIHEDLIALAGENDLSRAIFLFHSPPYKTQLDRAALDGQMVDHVPVDVHIGSIAIQRFIQAKQPYLTLHGHVHESAGLTGSWRDKIGETEMFSAAHDGSELVIIHFNIEDLGSACRIII